MMVRAPGGCHKTSFLLPTLSFDQEHMTTLVYHKRPSNTKNAENLQPAVAKFLVETRDDSGKHHCFPLLT